MAAPTRGRRRTSDRSKAYAYQVKMNWLRLYGTDPLIEVGLVRWDRLLREHYLDGVLPMDAARGIHATEVD